MASEDPVHESPPTSPVMASKQPDQEIPMIAQKASKTSSARTKSRFEASSDDSDFDGDVNDKDSSSNGHDSPANSGDASDSEGASDDNESSDDSARGGNRPSGGPRHGSNSLSSKSGSRTVDLSSDETLLYDLKISDYVQKLDRFLRGAMRKLKRSAATPVDQGGARISLEEYEKIKGIIEDKLTLILSKCESPVLDEKRQTYASDKFLKKIHDIVEVRDGGLMQEMARVVMGNCQLQQQVTSRDNAIQTYEEEARKQATLVKGLTSGDAAEQAKAWVSFEQSEIVRLKKEKLELQAELEKSRSDLHRKMFQMGEKEKTIKTLKEKRKDDKQTIGKLVYYTKVMAERQKRAEGTALGRPEALKDFDRDLAEVGRFWPKEFEAAIKLVDEERATGFIEAAGESKEAEDAANNVTAAQRRWAAVRAPPFPPSRTMSLGPDATHEASVAPLPSDEPRDFIDSSSGSAAPTPAMVPNVQTPEQLQSSVASDNGGSAAATTPATFATSPNNTKSSEQQASVPPASVPTNNSSNSSNSSQEPPAPRAVLRSEIHAEISRRRHLDARLHPLADLHPNEFSRIPALQTPTYIVGMPRDVPAPLSRVEYQALKTFAESEGPMFDVLDREKHNLPLERTKLPTYDELAQRDLRVYDAPDARYCKGEFNRLTKKAKKTLRTVPHSFFAWTQNCPVTGLKFHESNPAQDTKPYSRMQHFFDDEQFTAEQMEVLTDRDFQYLFVRCPEVPREGYSKFLLQVVFPDDNMFNLPTSREHPLSRASAWFWAISTGQYAAAAEAFKKMYFPLGERISPKEASYAESFIYEDRLYRDCRVSVHDLQSTYLVGGLRVDWQRYFHLQAKRYDREHAEQDVGHKRQGYGRHEASPRKTRYVGQPDFGPIRRNNNFGHSNNNKELSAGGPWTEQFGRDSNGNMYDEQGQLIFNKSRYRRDGSDTWGHGRRDGRNAGPAPRYDETGTKYSRNNPEPEGLDMSLDQMESRDNRDRSERRGRGRDRNTDQGRFSQFSRRSRSRGNIPVERRLGEPPNEYYARRGIEENRHGHGPRDVSPHEHHEHGLGYPREHRQIAGYNRGPGGGNSYDNEHNNGSRRPYHSRGPGAPRETRGRDNPYGYNN